MRALAGLPMTPSLASILIPEALESLIQDEEARSTLLAFLPEGHQTVQELFSSIHSPQLRQSLVQLSRALQGDDFTLIVSSLGLDPQPGASLLINGDGIGAFLEILEKAAEDTDETH